MSTPLSADWLRTAERDAKVLALVQCALPFLGSLNQPTARFETAKQGGPSVSTVVTALKKVVRQGQSDSHSGAQDNAEVAAFWLSEIANAGPKGPG